MGKGVGKIEEEWILACGLNELDRLLSVAFGQSGLVRRSFNDLLIFNNR